MQFLRTLQAGPVALACLFLVSCSAPDARRDYTLLAAPGSLDSAEVERFERARDYLRQGDLDGAMVLLEELEEAHPGQARIQALHAMAFWKLHRCEKAAKALENAGALGRKEGDGDLGRSLELAASDWIAQILDDQSACQDATARPLEQLLSLPHGRLAPRHLELLKAQVSALASAGRCDGALKLFEVLDARVLLQDSPTLEALARCLTMLGRDQRLLQLAEAFAAEDGPDADARILQLANIAEQRFRFGTAVSLLSMSSRPLGSPEVPLHLARLLLMDGRGQEAVIQLEAFCAQDGDTQLQSARLKQAAWLLGRFGMEEEAAQFFGRLEGIHGARWELLADRAALLWTAGRTSQALALLTKRTVAEKFAPRTLDQAVGFLVNVRAFSDARTLLAGAPASPLTKAMTEALEARQGGLKTLKTGAGGLNGPEADVLASLLCRLGFKQEASALLLQQFDNRALGTQGVLTAARCLPQANLEGPTGTGKLLMALALPQQRGRMKVSGSFLSILRKRGLLPLAQRHLQSLPGPATYLEADLALQTLLAQLPEPPQEGALLAAVHKGLADFPPWKKRELWAALAAPVQAPSPLPCLALAILESPGVFSSGDDWYASCPDCVPDHLATLSPDQRADLLLACKDDQRVPRLARWVGATGSDYGAKNRLTPLLHSLLGQDSADDAAALLLATGLQVNSLPQAEEADLLPALARRSQEAAIERARAIAQAQTMPREARIALAEGLTRSGASLVASQLVTEADLDSADPSVECSALTIRALAAVADSGELDDALARRLVTACPEHRTEALVEDLVRQSKPRLGARLAADYLLSHSGLDGRSLFVTGFEAARQSGAPEADQWLELLTRSSSPELLAMAGWSGALLGRLEPGAELLSRSLELRPGDERTLLRYLGVLSARRIIHAQPQDAKVPGMVQRYLESKLEDRPTEALDLILAQTLKAGLRLEAGAIFRLCSSRFPELTVSPLVRGTLALEEGRKDEAVEEFLAAVSGGPEPQKAAAEACSALRNGGHPQACVAVFDRALERVPEDGPTALAAAAVFLELGERQRGAALLAQALKSAPELMNLALPLIRSLQMDGLSEGLQDLLDEAALGTDSASAEVFSFLLRHYAITGQEQRLSTVLARLSRVTLPYFVEERAEQLYNLGFASEATALLEGRPGTGALSLGLHLLAAGDSQHGRALIMDFLEKTFAEMPRFGDDQAEVSGPVLALFGGVSSLLWESGLEEQSLWVLDHLARQFPGSPTLRVQILARSLGDKPNCGTATGGLKGLLTLPRGPSSSTELSSLVLRLHEANCGDAVLNLMASELPVSRSPWWMSAYVEEALRQGQPQVKLPSAEGLASLSPATAAAVAGALNRAGHRTEALAFLEAQLLAGSSEGPEGASEDEDGAMQRARTRRAEENELMFQGILASTERVRAFQELSRRLLAAAGSGATRHGARVRLAGLASRLDLLDEVGASLRSAIPLADNPTQEAIALMRNRLMAEDLPGARAALASGLVSGGGLETLEGFYDGAVSKLDLGFAKELLELGRRAFPAAQSLRVEQLKVVALEGDTKAISEGTAALLKDLPELQRAELAMQFGLILGALGHGDLAASLLAQAQHPRGLAVRAMEAGEAGKPKEAADLADQALAQSPARPFLLAAVFEQLPPRSEGLALASHLLKAMPPNARAYTPGASYWAAIEAARRGNLERALEFALRSARGLENRQERCTFLAIKLLDSGMPMPMVQQVLQVYFHGLDRRQTLAFLAETVLDLDPASSQSPGGIAMLEYTLARARALLKDAPGDEWLLAQQAETLRTLGRSEEAEGLYRRALLRSPGNPGLLNNLAYLLALEGRKLDEGLELARRALELDPSQAAFYLDTLGWLAFLKGDLPTAERQVRAALKAADFSAPSGLGECLYHLGRIKAAAGNRPEALRWFRMALFKSAPGYLRPELRGYLEDANGAEEVR